MTAQTAQHNIEMVPAMKWALILSVSFHVFLIIAGVVGMPFMKPPPPVLSDPIEVELVEVDEETTTNKPPAPKKAEKPPEEKLEEPKKQEKPPAPPKVTAKKPPKTVPPAPPELKEEVAPPKPDVPPPPSEALKEPPPKPKKPPEKEEKVVVNQEEAFMSVLKNLQESEPQSEEGEAKEEVKSEQSPLAKFSQRMTMSEADALRRQLSRCWSIQAGARYAEDLVVEVRLAVNPDRSVQKAVIVDQWRYNQDDFFRAAADSALRAVNSPLCNPLDLPPDKYELWNDIVVTFDPREML